MSIADKRGPAIGTDRPEVIADLIKTGKFDSAEPDRTGGIRNVKDFQPVSSSVPFRGGSFPCMMSGRRIAEVSMNPDTVTETVKRRGTQNPGAVRIGNIGDGQPGTAPVADRQFSVEIKCGLCFSRSQQ